MQYDGWIGLKVQNVGARVGNAGSPRRMWPQKTTTVFYIPNVLWTGLVQLSSMEAHCKMNMSYHSIYSSFKWSLMLKLLSIYNESWTRVNKDAKLISSIYYLIHFQIYLGEEWVVFNVFPHVFIISKHTTYTLVECALSWVTLILCKVSWPIIFAIN